VFVKSCIDLGRAHAGSTTFFGVGSPLVIGLGFLALGGVLMAIWRVAGHKEFFARRRETAGPETLGHEKQKHSVPHVALPVPANAVAEPEPVPAAV
jgi:hypothetical protein